MADTPLATPKGFRDFLPADSKKRNKVLSTLKKVFESYGFEPLETPAIEYASILKGKYGEEEKLIYEFKDRGDRELALRYDQTVPLARVIAQYPTLPKPFKRYQLQNVYRAENTQKGRYREFLQADIDTVGTTSLLADAEVIAVGFEAALELGLKSAQILLNDRSLFEGVDPKIVSAIDKLDKVGDDEVLDEMVAKGLSKSAAKKLLTDLKEAKPTDKIQQIITLIKKFNSKIDVVFKPTLARGLNYYTGSIFEMIVSDKNSLSIGGGGRYDHLIGMFSKQDYPAVGFSFGFDRLVEVLDEQGLLKDNEEPTVLVTIFQGNQEKSIELAQELRTKGIKAEVYLENADLNKQLKYADQKKIKYAIIPGTEELTQGQVTLKNLFTKSQEKVSLAKLVDHLK